MIDEKGKIVTSIRIREGKTKKEKEFILNRAAKKAIQEYLDSLGDFRPNLYLLNHKRTKKAISREQAYMILNKAARMVGMRGQ